MPRNKNPRSQSCLQVERKWNCQLGIQDFNRLSWRKMPEECLEWLIALKIQKSSRILRAKERYQWGKLTTRRWFRSTDKNLVQMYKLNNIVHVNSFWERGKRRKITFSGINSSWIYRRIPAGWILDDSQNNIQRHFQAVCKDNRRKCNPIHASL